MFTGFSVYYCSFISEEALFYNLFIYLNDLTYGVKFDVIYANFSFGKVV